MKKTKLEKIKTRINTLKAQQRIEEKKQINNIARSIIKAGFGSMPADKIISILSKHKEESPNSEDKSEGSRISKFFN